VGSVPMTRFAREHSAKTRIARFSEG